LLDTFIRHGEAFLVKQKQMCGYKFGTHFVLAAYSEANELVATLIIGNRELYFGEESLNCSKLFLPTEGSCRHALILPIH
jgi:hypothetical protein